MVENSNNGAWLGIGIGLGILIGGLFMYAIIKNKQAPITQAMQPISLPLPFACPAIGQSPIIQTHSSKISDIDSDTQKIIPQDKPISTYKNNEETIYEYDADGNIIRKRVIRDAKVN